MRETESSCPLAAKMKNMNYEPMIPFGFHCSSVTMKKLSMWLFIAGFGNLLFLGEPMLEEGWTGSEYPLASGIGRLLTSLWMIWAAADILKLRVRGWYLFSAFMWFLFGLAVMSPFWIAFFTSPAGGMEGVMIFAGQWAGAMLIAWAYFGWWRRQKFRFVRAPEDSRNSMEGDRK